MALVAVARPAAATALASGRRPGPRQGAFVLAVSRDGTGRGGVLAVEFKAPFGRLVCGALGGAESGYPTEGADDHYEFELERNMRDTSSVEVVLLDAEDMQRKFYQGMLARHAISSFSLWEDVANRLKPDASTKLYQGLNVCGETFVTAALRSSKFEGTWKSASDVVQALDLLRRLVSSAVVASLPQDWALPLDAVECDNAEMELFHILQRTYLLVARDVEDMLAGDAN